MSEKEPNKPLHKQIEEDLLEKILSGHYRENELIPKEVELAEMYQVSRPTIRQAVHSLAAAGYLERKKRKGTIVKKKKISQEFTHIIESFDSEMYRKGLSPRSQVLAFKLDKANEEIAEQLKLKEGEQVYKLLRLRFVQEEPIVLVTTYLPAGPLKNFLDHDFTSKRLYEALAESGYPIKKVIRRLDVIKADETTGDLLNIAAGEPLFYFHTVGYSDQNLPMEYSISKYRGDLNSFIFEVDKT